MLAVLNDRSTILESSAGCLAWILLLVFLCGLRPGGMVLHLPPVKQVLMFVLAFSGLVYYLLLEVALLDVLYVNAANVSGVQLTGDHRALVKLSDGAVYQDVVDEFVERVIPLPGDWVRFV